MSFSLYEISNDYLQALDQAYLEDELDEKHLTLLNNLEDSIENKAVNIASFIKNLEAESLSVKFAAKEMQERSKKIDNKIEYLANYLKSNLETCGIKEVNKSPNFVIKIKQNPPSVVINDENAIPANFKLKKEIISIDRIAIKQAINDGYIVEGANLESKTRLEIK